MTDLRFAEVDARRDALIARHRYMIQQVFGGDDPNFVYTIGLAQRGLPEFLFIGSASPASADYLRGFVDESLAGRPPAPGLHAPGTPANPYRVPAWLIETDHRLRTHAFGVGSHLARHGLHAVRPRLMQVVMPSMSGRFPWEPGYDWLDQMVDRPPVAGRA